MEEADEEIQDAAAEEEDAQADQDEEDVENDPVREVSPLSLFIKIIPATFDITKDGSVVPTEMLIAIATVVPAPGVDVFNCLERITHGCSCSAVRDERGWLGHPRNDIAPILHRGHIDHIDIAIGALMAGQLDITSAVNI